MLNKFVDDHSLIDHLTISNHLSFEHALSNKSEQDTFLIPFLLTLPPQSLCISCFCNEDKCDEIQ